MTAEPEHTIVESEMHASDVDAAELKPLPSSSRRRVMGVHPLALLMVVVAFVVLFTNRMQPQGGQTVWDKLTSRASEAVPPVPENKATLVATTGDGQSVAVSVEPAASLAKLKERFRARKELEDKAKQKEVGTVSEATANHEQEKSANVADVVAVAPKAVAVAEVEEANANASAPKEATEPQPEIKVEKSAVLGQSAGRIEALEAQIHALSAQAERSQQQEALLRLHVQVQTGQPFLVQLRAVESLSHLTDAQREVLQRLQPFAQEGIPTRVQLQELLNQQIRAWQLRPLPESAGFWRKTWHNITGLVRVRKIGEFHRGVDDESCIARAEVHLKRGLYQDVQSELKSLSPESASYFTDVMYEIVAFQDAMAAVTGLQAIVIAQPVEIEKEL